MTIFRHMRVRHKQSWDKRGYVVALHVFDSNRLSVCWDGRRQARTVEPEEIEPDPNETERNEKLLNEIMTHGGRTREIV